MQTRPRILINRSLKVIYFTLTSLPSFTYFLLLSQLPIPRSIFLQVPDLFLLVSIPSTGVNPSPTNLDVSSKSNVVGHHWSNKIKLGKHITKSIFIHLKFNWIVNEFSSLFWSIRMWRYATDVNIYCYGSHCSQSWKLNPEMRAQKMSLATDSWSSSDLGIGIKKKTPKLFLELKYLSTLLARIRQLEHDDRQ